MPKNHALYVRPTRGKPSLAFLHKSAADYIDEFAWARHLIKCDADLRSMCSQGFAQKFFLSVTRNYFDFVVHNQKSRRIFVQQNRQ